MEKITDKKQNGWRGSRDFWIDAAYELLVTSGVDAVKVMPMAKKLGISRTSFYWHFDDRESLLEALVKRWRDKNTTNLVSQTKTYAETITEAVLNLFDCWIDPQLFDARLDFAIRNWAQMDASLKKILKSADQQRITAIRAMFSKFDYDPQQADTRALTVYYTQMGYIAMMVEEPVDQRIEKMPDYVKIYSGLSPTSSEIARFKARHRHRIPAIKALLVK